MVSLADAYLAGDEVVRAFFAQAPEDLFVQTPRARPWGKELTEAIRVYNERLGLACCFAGDEAVVLTGQQPGIFTGPLYTIYKAITAIKAAGELAERTGKPVVPMFWIGSEDHDFAEANTTCVLTKQHRPLRLTYEPAASVAGLPMYRVPLETQLHELCDTLADAAPGSEWTDAVRRVLHETADAAVSLADWTAHLLARLFRDTPLVLFAPHMLAAREAAAPIMRAVLADPLAATRLVNEAGSRIEAAGYSPQITKADDECPFFVEMGGRRRKVLYQDGQFFLPEENMYCPGDALEMLLNTAPERFSPNVALRCIVQQRLFPAAAYVAGPGEIAYWAQLKPLFRNFGEDMPLVYPRLRVRLTDIKLNKLRTKLCLREADLVAPEEHVVQGVLKHVAKNPALEVIEEHRNALMGATEDFVNAMYAVENAPPEVKAGARRLQEGLGRELDKLARGAARADEAQVAAIRGQVRRVCAALAPYRKPQERVYCVFSYLFAQGWGLTPRLIDALDVHNFDVQEIEL
ncbi:MAG: bacillithiol biosynthesis cysteine-adding enzyme BshC [Candidatus Hydrogenedentota bacterium]